MLDLIPRIGGGYIDLNDLAPLAEKATAGPWHRSGARQRITEECFAVGADQFSIIAVPVGQTNESHRDALRDADFVAAANPLVIQSLIAEIRRLRASAPAATSVLAIEAAAR